MKKNLLSLIFICAAANGELQETIIAALGGLFGGAVLSNWFSDYSAKRDAKHEINAAKRHIAAIQQKYGQELELIRQNQFSETTLKKFSDILKAKGMCFNDYYDQCMLDLQKSIASEQKNETNISTWLKEENFNHYAHQATALQATLITQVHSLDQLSQLIYTEQDFFGLHDIMTRKIEMKYQKELELFKNYSSRQLEYENKLYEWARINAPEKYKIFPLLAAIERMQHDKQDLEAKIRLCSQNQQFNNFKLHRELLDHAHSFYRAITYAYNTITCSEAFQQEKINSQNNEFYERQIQAQEKIAQSAERDSLARLKEAENHERDSRNKEQILANEAVALRLQIMGYPQLMEDKKKLEQHNIQLQKEKQTVEGLLKGLSKQIDQLHAHMNAADREVASTLDEIVTPSMNPELPEYKELIMSKLRRALGWLRKREA